MEVWRIQLRSLGLHSQREDRDDTIEMYMVDSGITQALKTHAVPTCV